MSASLRELEKKVTGMKGELNRLYGLDGDAPDGATAHYSFEFKPSEAPTLSPDRHLYSPSNESSGQSYSFKFSPETVPDVEVLPSFTAERLSDAYSQRGPGIGPSKQKFNLCQSSGVCCGVGCTKGRDLTLDRPAADFNAKAPWLDLKRTIREQPLRTNGSADVNPEPLSVIRDFGWDLQFLLAQQRAQLTKMSTSIDELERISSENAYPPRRMC